MKRGTGAKGQLSFAVIQVTLALEGLELLRAEEEDLLENMVASGVADTFENPTVLQSIGIAPHLKQIQVLLPYRPGHDPVVLEFVDGKWQPILPPKRVPLLVSEEADERVDPNRKPSPDG